MKKTTQSSRESVCSRGWLSVLFPLLVAGVFLFSVFTLQRSSHLSHSAMRPAAEEDEDVSGEKVTVVLMAYRMHPGVSAILHFYACHRDQSDVVSEVVVVWNGDAAADLSLVMDPVCGTVRSPV